MFALFQMLLLSLLLVTTTLASPLTEDVLLEDEERLLNLDNNLVPDTKEREITYKSAGESGSRLEFSRSSLISFNNKSFTNFHA